MALLHEMVTKGIPTAAHTVGQAQHHVFIGVFVANDGKNVVSHKKASGIDLILNATGADKALYRGPQALENVCNITADIDVLRIENIDKDREEFADQYAFFVQEAFICGTAAVYLLCHL